VTDDPTPAAHENGVEAAYVPVTPPSRSDDALGPAVEVVSAGNEVLLGDVLDTNTNWLCVRVTTLGGHVRRTVMLRDEVESIAAELRAVIAGRPALIFTVGGLGPTTDDLTLAGVAAALDVPLVLHPDAERMVSERYAEFAKRKSVPFAGLNEPRRKMARLPRGATPLLNPVGGAPGVLIRLDRDGRIAGVDAGATTIVSLPGVPAELKAIVDESLADELHRIFGDARFEERTLLLATHDESAIAHVLAAVERAHPDVYIKSRAQVIGSEQFNRITAAARGSDEEVVSARLDPVIADLIAGITAAGYEVRPLEDEDEG